MLDEQTGLLQEDLTDQDLKRLCRSGIIGVDTETTGINVRRDILSLVQICDIDGQFTLIRTENWLKAERLRALMADSNVQKIFHFALFDCAMLFRHLKTDVLNPYCTKIASKFARTYSSSHSLAALVHEFFNIRLDKSKQSSFWLDDTLDTEQLTYLYNDTRWLIQIKQHLDIVLEKKGLLPTGMSYVQLNRRSQDFLPTLVHLWLNDWEFGPDSRGEQSFIFAH